MMNKNGIIVFSLLFILFFPSGRFFFVSNSFCQNIALVTALRGNASEANSCLGLVDLNSRVFWLRGRNLWLNGDQRAAENVWQHASNYSAKMLVHNVQGGALKPYTDVIKMALFLDPYSQETAGEAAFWLTSRSDWKANYRILSEVLQKYPDSAIVKSALALTSDIYGESTFNPIQLFDKAFQAEPENRYVILYGFRLMMKDPDFDQERIVKLVEAGEQLLPEDFAFTLNLANAYRKLGDYSKARVYNLWALELNPNHAVSNLQQIELLLLADQDPVDYDEWLQIAIEARVKNASYYRRLIIVLLKLNKDEEASTIYCEGLSYGFSANVLTPPTELEISEHLFASCSG